MNAKLIVIPVAFFEVELRSRLGQSDPIQRKMFNFATAFFVRPGTGVHVRPGMVVHDGSERAIIVSASIRG